MTETSAQSRAHACFEGLKRPARSLTTALETDCSNGNGSKHIRASELFGCNVFSFDQMERTLPRPVFAKLAAQMAGKGLVDKDTADAIAHAVKVWAMERGGTHFTHWFQPQNNLTAEKHDSFLTLKYGTLHNNLNVRRDPLNSSCGLTRFGLGDGAGVFLGEPAGPGRA